jgi:hypothetical protein
MLLGAACGGGNCRPAGRGVVSDTVYKLQPSELINCVELEAVPRCRNLEGPLGCMAYAMSAGSMDTSPIMQR